MKINKKTEYKVENDYSIEYEKLSSLKDISQFKNAEDLMVLTVINTEKKTGIYNSLEEKSFNVVLKNDELDKFLNSSESEMAGVLKEITSNRSKDGNIFVLPKEYLSSFIKYNANNDKYLSINYSKNYLKDLKSKDYELVQLVDCVHKNIYKDSSGHYYMEPLRLDYISAIFDNGKYLLDDFVEELSKKSGIAFEVEDKKSFRKKIMLPCPLKGDEPQIQDIISSIPHYNCDEERNEQATIIFYPTQEEIVQMLDSKDSFSLEYFVLEEILGGKDFLKSPPKKDIGVELPKRKFSRN